MLVPLDPALVESIKEEIIDTLTKRFGIETYETQQNHLGYRNLKWKLETNFGPVFVKQFDSTRYPGDAMGHVRRALQMQDALQKEGFPTPSQWAYEDELVQQTSSGQQFVVMSFSPGELVKPGQVNAEQMRHLGELTGWMHRFFNEGDRFPHAAMPWKIKRREQMMEGWRTRWAEAERFGVERILVALENQRRIILNFPFDELQALEPGWTHWDMWVDNLLFAPDQVTAVLDFDRLKTVYPDMDLARAVLSCALDDGEMKLNVVRAFLEGYRERRPYPKGRFVQALQILWCLERGYVSIAAGDTTAPVKRFREELIWLSNHWWQLDELFGEM